MTGSRSIWLVALRELRERIASRAFQVSTAFTILIVLAALFLPTAFGAFDAPEYEIGVVNTPEQPLALIVETGAFEEDTIARIIEFTNEDELRTAITDGDVQIGVVDGAKVLHDGGTPPELLALTGSAMSNVAIEQTATDLGLTAADLQRLFEQDVVIESIEKDTGEDGDQALFAFIGAMLLFTSILTYGQWILIGVVEEKSSRVVEVVLGAVQPRHLLAGKVIGIGILGVGQLLVLIAIGLIGIRMVDLPDLPTIGPGTLGALVLWFTLGFGFYATGFAVTGSLVSRQEEAQNASFPLTMVMLVAYFLSTTVLSGDVSPALRIVSLIPPFSPITMLTRQVVGDAAPWEVVVAVVLMLGAIVLMLRLGGRIYSGGLLKTGGKVKVREALRSSSG